MKIVGLHQKYTSIVRSSLLRIGDDACCAQSAISPEELAQLDGLEIAQLLCDCERALKNTRIAVTAIGNALKTLPFCRICGASHPPGRCAKDGHGG